MQTWAEKGTKVEGSVHLSGTRPCPLLWLCRDRATCTCLPTSVDFNLEDLRSIHFASCSSARMLFNSLQAAFPYDE